MTSTLIIGIDLGNSNTSLSYFTPGTSQSAMVPLEDGRHVMPSVVLFPYDGSEPRVGTPARSGSKKGLLFENFKGRLMEEAEPASTTDRGQTKSPLDALTTILRHLATLAFGHGELNPHFVLRRFEDREQYAPRVPIYVTIGVPAEAPEHYKSYLRQACIASGWLTEEQTLEYLSFITEPIAVALNYPPGERRQFFIYDHGGLTLDMVRIQLDIAKSPPYKVLASSERVTCVIQGRSRNIGGSILDRVLLGFVLTRAGGVAQIQKQISEAYEAEFDAGRLEALVQMRQDPDPNQADPESRVYKELCHDMERLRIMLSSPKHDSLLLSLGSGLLPVRTRIIIKKEDLDEAFRDIFSAIRQKLPPPAGDADFCFMVGGCSLTPALESLQREHFGSMRVIVPRDPMETIAKGLSRYYPSGVTDVSADGGGEEIVDTAVDTDYGIWNSEGRCWDVVLAKGTPFSVASLPKTGIPGADKGVFRVYQPVVPSTEIRLRVAQREPTAKGGWVELGERTVHLPSATTHFRVYFGMIPQQGLLEMRLSSIGTKKGVIPINDARFQPIKTEKEQ